MKILIKKILIAFYCSHLFLSMYSSLSAHRLSDKGSILYYLWQVLSFPLFGRVGEILVYDFKIINYELLFFLNSALCTFVLYLVLRHFRE